MRLVETIFSPLHNHPFKANKHQKAYKNFSFPPSYLHSISRAKKKKYRFLSLPHLAHLILTIISPSPFSTPAQQQSLLSLLSA